MPRSRRGRCFSPAELDRFLRRLAVTGNMTLAAETIGRPVRSLRARRRTDPVFAAHCEAALAIFRSGSKAGQPATAPDGHRGALQTAGGEWVVVRGGPHGGGQLRRAQKGRLTAAGLALFLRTVAATANLSLAARSVGVTTVAINQRRRRDVAFDQQVVEALKEGCERLETQLLESALRGVGVQTEDEDDALPGETEAAAFAPHFPPMTAYEAIIFLEKQRELLARPKRWSAERDREIMKLATARLEQAMKRFKLLPRPGLDD